MTDLCPVPPPHDHPHGHDQHDHRHDHSHNHAPEVTQGNERRIAVIFVLTALFAGAEAFGGWWSGSLALMADAGHMLSDAAALALALLACRLAARAADATHSYGWHRARVLAALLNGITLFLLTIWISWEALARLRMPAEILTGPMLAVAVAGLLVNLIGAYVLTRGHQGDQNLRGALLHVMGDLLGSVGAILAALGIRVTGWTALDPILSVLVCLLILRSARGLIGEALAVLMQRVPAGLDPGAVLRGLAQLPGVQAAGHFHAWVLADRRIIATVELVPAPGADLPALSQAARAWLMEHHQIPHATIGLSAALSPAPGCAP